MELLCRHKESVQRFGGAVILVGCLGGGSMRTTSQPRSARTMPVKGAIAMPASSRTVPEYIVSYISLRVGVYGGCTDLLTPPKVGCPYYFLGSLCCCLLIDIVIQGCCMKYIMIG